MCTRSRQVHKAKSTLLLIGQCFANIPVWTFCVPQSRFSANPGPKSLQLLYSRHLISPRSPRRPLPPGSLGPAPPARSARITPARRQLRDVRVAAICVPSKRAIGTHISFPSLHYSRDSLVVNPVIEEYLSLKNTSSTSRRGRRVRGEERFVRRIGAPSNKSPATPVSSHRLRHRRLLLPLA